MTPEDGDRLRKIGDFWESDQADGLHDVAGVTGTVTDDVRFLLRLLEDQFDLLIDAAADVARYEEIHDNPTPNYEVQTSSTVYMCGHHPYTLSRAGERGEVTVLGDPVTVERLVDWLNRKQPTS